MNNVGVLQQLDNCSAELTQVQTIIAGLGSTSNVVPYLTKFAVIRACGTVEFAFKNIIADYCSHRSKTQVKRFIDRRVREGSANPSLQNIHKFLKDFDPNWLTSFKASVDLEVNKANLQTSLQSLVDARNEFAHGGNPACSLTDVITYFAHSRRLMEILDSVIV